MQELGEPNGWTGCLTIVTSEVKGHRPLSLELQRRSALEKIERWPYPVPTKHRSADVIWGYGRTGANDARTARV